MKVSEVMHGILACDEKARLHEVVEKMMDAQRGSIIVLRNKTPIGMFTERDALRLIAGDRSVKGLVISDIMSPLRFMVDEDTPIYEASRIMDENDIRRLPIIDKQGNLIGIVTAASIAKNKKFMMARELASSVRGESIYA